MKAYLAYSYFFVFFLVFSTLEAQEAKAQVYECHVGGKVIYTNKSKDRCHTAKLNHLGAYSASTSTFSPAVSSHYKVKKTTIKTRSNTSAQVSPKNTHTQVSHQTQKKRDGTRFQLLTTELDNEKKALSLAQKTLTHNQKKASSKTTINKDHLRRLEASILDRQENIKALEQEIARI